MSAFEILETSSDIKYVVQETRHFLKGNEVLINLIFIDKN